MPVGPFELYLAEINKIPLLKPEEEYELATRYYQDKDVTAAHRLITANLRFVVKIALEYQFYGLKLSDLVQEGNIGLMQAVKKFNPERGCRLISYAVWWIRAYIQNFILKSWSLVKIGTTQARRKLFFKLKQTQERLRKLHYDDIEDFDEVASLAETFGVKRAEIEEMNQRLIGHDLSLDVRLSDEEDAATHLELLTDQNASVESTLMECQRHAQLEERVADVISQLKPREQFIVRNRLMASSPMTLQEIGSQFGVSKERVRQVENNLKKKLVFQLAPAYRAA
jgi:RNA polymerase sigma-32 factor